MTDVIILNWNFIYIFWLVFSNNSHLWFISAKANAIACVSVCEIETLTLTLNGISNSTYGEPSGLFKILIELNSIGWEYPLDLIDFITASLDYLPLCLLT